MESPAKTATVFNSARMDRLIRNDRFLLHQFIDAIEKHPHDYDRALEVVFNTYILEDSVMERKYREA